MFLQSYIANTPIAAAALDTSGQVRFCNNALALLLGKPTTATEGGWSFLEQVPENRQAEFSALMQHTLGGAAAQPPFALEIPRGTSTATLALYMGKVEQDTGTVLVVYVIDTTEQKNLELRFTHSQKMQAVGQLAGGIAHDFNNLLTAMIGFCDLLLMRHPPGDQSFADIMQIKQNANRAANLVRQLLAFSRRQTLQPRMLDVTDVLAELANLVRRLIGENIDLKMIHGREVGLVKADQGQLEQVMINLAVNARDAMTNGGTLTIASRRLTVDKNHPVAAGMVAPAEEDVITPGEYVCVEVTDTGTGIPAALLQKIFEPFFSTKEVGSGTGLGLATVYGIVKQTGGYIYVKSEEGKGTSFQLFFPRHDPAEAEVVAERETELRGGADLTGKGTVLLVEDEAPVRLFAARALRNKGYIVLEADSGETGLEVMEQRGKDIDIIVTDVVMPGMNGPVMVEHIAKKFPEVKVIFISGYAEDAFMGSYGADRAFHFLPKPFTLKQLASKVKEVLMGKAS